MLAQLKKAADMSPAERLLETKKIANRKQIRFRTGMIEAKTYTVDITDDDNFGKDVDGNDIDMKDMIFISTSQYLKGIQLIEGEIGCFLDESSRKPPIRILAKRDPE